MCQYSELRIFYTMKIYNLFNCVIIHRMLLEQKKILDKFKINRPNLPLIISARIKKNRSFQNCDKFFEKTFKQSSTDRVESTLFGPRKD